ncbi:DDE Tnp4 domain-containing protein [Abeliophyllum distichum]|uniref:DDE Tnp4 domain-containing protein n=1 Tax=Abeliophyllum distichum TaxID=126358 RepID=A0ABD1U0V7_9LAMI
MNDQFVYESVRIADSDDNSSDDEDMDRLEQDIQVWLDCCRATESRVRDYLQRCHVRIRRFPNSRNGHIFMLEALQDDPQIAFQEFRMYPPLFVNFTHLLRDEFGLSSGQNVDIYEQVVVALGARIIRPKPNYNESPPGHRPCPNKHPHFQSRWTILDRMTRYPFRKQTAVVVAAITVHNFIRRAGQRDNIGSTATEDEEAAEIDLPDEIEQTAADYNAPQISNTEWDQYRDFLARQL